MSLTLTFPIADPLRECLDNIKEPLATTRAIVVVIENETLVLWKKPIEASENLANDLEDVRKELQADGCCFVIIKLDEKQFAQVMHVPEGTKPKVKMLYAGSSAHLRESSRLAIATDTHVTKVDEIVPLLFGRDVVGERKVLMTDSEKVRDELSRMEIAPQRPTGLPGVANPLDEDALVAVEQIKNKKLRAATFIVTAKGAISVEKTLPISEHAWTSILSEEEPRFALINWKDDVSVILLYVCPEGCKPKMKMPYASTKASFVAQINHQEVKPRKSVETSTPKDAEAVIEEHLNGAQLEDDVKPIAPKSIMPKGPRMLI